MGAGKKKEGSLLLTKDFRSENDGSLGRTNRSSNVNLHSLSKRSSKRATKKDRVDTVYGKKASDSSDSTSMILYLQRMNLEMFEGSDDLVSCPDDERNK